jgi:hypothetical protein
MQSVKKPKTELNQEFARPLPSHYQSPMEIANQESYYEPNPVSPVAGRYYDYQYNGGAPGPSQPIESLTPEAREVPQEYYIGPPNVPYVTTPAHYTKQQYYNQAYVDPSYYYYDYAPIASKGPDPNPSPYQSPNYQQQVPEQYYYYTEGERESNSNNSNRYPRTNPTIPVYSYSQNNQASKSYGQQKKTQNQEQGQAMYYNFVPGNNYSNYNNPYDKPG